MFIKRFKVNSALLYVAGSFLVQGISLLTTPVFTRIMTPSDYGSLSVFNLWVSILGTIIGLQTNGSIMNAKISFGNDKLDGYMSSVLTISTGSFLLLFVVSLMSKNFFASMLNIDVSLVPVLFIQSYLSFCISFMSSKYVALERPIKFFLISVSNTIFTVGFSILFVLHMQNDKYLGRIYATLLVSFVIGIGCLLDIFLKGRKFIDLSYWKFCIPLTLPLILHGLSNLLLNQADRYMLSIMKNSSITGIYSFAYTLGSIIFVIWLAINNAWVPWYYERCKESNNKEILHIYNLYSFIFVTITLGFIFVSPEIVRLMGSSSFQNGVYITPMIASGSFFMYLYSFPVNFEFYRRKTLFISIGTFSSALINIGLNLFMIPFLGSMGAAISTLISYILLFIFHYIIARVIIKGFQIPLRALVLPGVIILIATGLFYLLINNTIIRWLLAIILLALLVHKVKNYKKESERV